MPIAEDHAELAYTLDAENRIIATSPHWDRFALENGGEGACSAHVLQRNVLDFVTGGELRLLLENLFKQVRGEVRTMRIPFRCDAPTRRRHLLMHLTPGVDARVVVRTELKLVEERPAAQEAPASVLSPLLLCAWCNRLKLDGAWRELERGITHLDLFGTPSLPPLNHGICEDCVGLLEAEMPKTPPTSRREGETR